MTVAEVAVAQAVEQWHSILVGRVQIPGLVRAFWFIIAVNLFSLGIGLSRVH